MHPWGRRTGGRGWLPQRGASAYLGLISSPAEPDFYCHKGIWMSIVKDPKRMFNWTTDKVETCDSGSFCQESLLMIKSGKARKGSWVGWEGE